MASNLYRWLDSRLRLKPVEQTLLDEPIPGGASWIYVFGSATLFASPGALAEHLNARLGPEPFALDPEVDWPAALDAYYDEHDQIGTGGPARSPRLVEIDETDASATGLWRIEQITHGLPANGGIASQQPGNGFV